MKTSRIPAYFLCSVTLLLTFCGRETPGGMVTRTTIGDTLIVTTTPPAELPESLFRFDRELAIGVSEGESVDDPYMLSWIVDLVVDEDGRMYVSEYEDREVRVFDSEGQFLRRFGRAGQGPGEFHSGSMGIQPVSILHDGRIVVQDHPYSLEVFGIDGVYQTSVNLTPLNLRTQTPGRAFFPIHWLSQTQQLVIPWRDSSNRDGTSIRFLLTDETFTTLHWLPGSISYLDSYTEGSSSIALPFIGDAVWTITGESILVQAKGDSYSLMYYDIIRDRWLKAILNIEPEPVSAADIRLYIDQRLSRMPEPVKARFEPIYNRASYPKQKPFMDHLTGDDQGRIWVARDVETYLTGTPDEYTYDLFNNRGEWLGIVKSPRSWDFINGDYAYVVAGEEYPVIERYRITLNH